MAKMNTIRKTTDQLSFSDLLGGQRLLNVSISNYYDLVILSRVGISKASAESLIGFTGMSKKNFLEDILNMSIKTFERKRNTDKLDRIASSLLIEIARVLTHVYLVFFDEKTVKRWLSKPSKSLHGESPLSLFSTPTGIGMVEDVLTRIEEGVYS
jgi:putative toxin-antitoxin system antitoxin component (TIGR02293 family)